ARARSEVKEWTMPCLASLRWLVSVVRLDAVRRNARDIQVAALNARMLDHTVEDTGSHSNGVEPLRGQAQCARRPGCRVERAHARPHRGRYWFPFQRSRASARSGAMRETSRLPL